MTLSAPVVATAGAPAGVGALDNITFKVTVSGGTSAQISSLLGSSTDWLTKCLTAYGAFTLGSGFNLAQLQAAAGDATVFPGDADAQQWIVDALVTLDALYQVMTSVTLPATLPANADGAYEFSVIEALYARGFTSAAHITDLSSNDFQQALTGTVAYDLAGAIYTSASVIAPATSPATPPAGFQPINSDGSLTNCVPAPCASPLGPIAYLNEMLALSQLSTGETPSAPTVSLSTSADNSGSVLPFVSTAGVITGMAVTGVNIPDWDDGVECDCHLGDLDPADHRRRRHRQLDHVYAGHVGRRRGPTPRADR